MFFLIVTLPIKYKYVIRNLVIGIKILDGIRNYYGIKCLYNKY